MSAQLGIEERVAEIRAFNRFYTNRIGVLRGGLHGSRHPLPEARVLFELGRADVTEVGDLRRRLDMDGGHLSRLLTRLDEQGLLARERSPDDGRRRRLRLTTAGRTVYRQLDRGAGRQWRALLDELPDAQQRRLLAGLQTVRAVLEDPPAGEAVVLRGPAPGDLGWIVERHGDLYAQEYGWGAGFEALVARVVADFAAAPNAPGSPRSTAPAPAACCACAATGPARPSCGSCSSSRGRAGWGSAAG